jgi:hypothetical protein
MDIVWLGAVVMFFVGSQFLVGLFAGLQSEE